MRERSGSSSSGAACGWSFGPHRVVAGTVFLALLFGLFYLFAFSTEEGRADTAYDDEELQFLDLINEYRAENGLGELTLSDDLTVAAEHHNEDMGEYGFFAHDTAASSYYEPGSEPWDRMAAEGYSHNAYKGENLAAGYETAEEALAAWKASPSHNSAMLNANYRVMGVSRLDVDGSPFGWYWTTDFGSFADQSTPSSESAQPETQQPETQASDARRQTGEIVRNGGFVGAGGWDQEARDGAKLILRGQFVRMGGYDDGVDQVRQRVRVEPGAVLGYDLMVSSTGNGDPNDRLTVRLTDADGEPVAALERYSGRDEMEWSRQNIRLPESPDADLYLTFDARTNGERDTYFYLDNVSVRQ